jgi:hypothetical protein
MSEDSSSPRVSRRSVLGGGAAAAVAVALPASLRATGQQPGTGIANVRVSHDHYGAHIEPSVAANPRHPRHLLAACQASHTADPQFIATYLSFDAGATGHSGALPQPPAGQAPASDDVTVTFDQHGRGYLCASRASNTPGGRAMFAWRTDDGGRSFSGPVALVPTGQYFDHPGIAAGTGRTQSEHNVYVAWAADDSATALKFTRSTNGGQSFEAPRTILPEATGRSAMSAGPEIAAGPHGLVCAACYWTSNPAGGKRGSGDIVGKAVAVCSTDGGRSFAAPVHLGSGSPVISLPGHVKPDATPAVAISPSGDALLSAVSEADRVAPGFRH